MKQVAIISFLAILGTLFLLSPVFAQEESEDKTLSPYFFVQSDDPSVDRLPLESTTADVNIAGVIADVKVTQVYKNEGNRALEAIYVFPASTRAAVYGMTMTIGERVITAKIKKKEDARRDYEEAKQQGKSASLLEQQRPNVFQMNVANIMPGDRIKVELHYTELLVPMDKTYEFIYPTVVGPRYSNQPASTAPASEKWVENPYLQQGQDPTYTFDMKVTISAGLPIQKVFCTSHKVNVAYDGPATGTVTLDPSDKTGGNKDFILKYQLAGKKVESGVLLYEGEKENFFLLMLQPPERVKTASIPGREYIFIVDVSGSMYGFPLDISKKLLKDLIGNLRPTDTFNILLFSGGSHLMAERSVPATSANIANAINVIDHQHGGGGTELLPALNRALTLPHKENFSRTFVIVTDGYVSVEKEAFDLIRNSLGNANMFAFGIGSSVNRHLIEGMAHVGMGEPFIITKQDEAPGKAEKFRKLIQTPVLTNIHVDYDKFDVYDVEPISIPDVLADRPIVLFGKWKGKPEGKITLTGMTGEGAYRQVVDVKKASPSDDNSALRYLWARHRIMILADYNRLAPDDKRIKEVTDLGLTYNLLTDYTSFIAVDSEVRNKDGQQTTVKQPLPLPEGVSNYAIGGRRSMGYASSPAAMPMRSYKSKAPMAEEMADLSAAKGASSDMLEKDAELEVREEQVMTAKLEVKADKSVESVVQKHKAELEKCLKDTGLKGTMVLKIKLNADGTVASVKIDRNSIMDKGVVKCILSKVKKWTIPTAKKEITITLIFN